MSRVERIGAATLYCGDCREILPTLGQVDAVVTDPPYGEAMGFEGDDSPAVATELATAAFAALKGICRPGGYAVSFWTMRSLDLLMDAARAGGWGYCRTLAMQVSGNARPHLSWVPRLQPILLLQNGKGSDLHDRFSVWLKARIENSGLSVPTIAKVLGVDSRLVMKWSRYRDPSWCLPTERHYPALKELLSLSNEFDELLFRDRARREPRDYWRDLYDVETGQKKSGHPAEKPLAVISHLVRGVADVGETVIDPFMGSGTTGVACARLGRSFIGIEIEPEYFDTACRRIEAAHRQADLFVRQPDAATPDMFAEVA